MTKVINRYHLDGFMLKRYVNDSLRWVTWVDPGDDPGDEGLFVLAGPCVIHAEPPVIELGPCKLRGAAEERSMDEVQQLLTSLPQWRETRWYAKHDDGGQLSTSDWWLEWRECATDEPAGVASAESR
jgi:hypothetical protein